MLRGHKRDLWQETFHFSMDKWKGSGSCDLEAIHFQLRNETFHLGFPGETFPNERVPVEAIRIQ